MPSDLRDYKYLPPKKYIRLICTFRSKEWYKNQLREFTKGLFIKYVHSVGRGVVQLKAYWPVLEGDGGSAVSLRTP